MDYSSMIQQMMQARQPQQMRPPTAGMLPPQMGMNAQRPQPQPSMGGPMGMQQRPMQPMGQPPQNPYTAMVQQMQQARAPMSQQQGGYHPLQPGGQLLGSQMGQQPQQNYLGGPANQSTQQNQNSMFGAMGQSFASKPQLGSQMPQQQNYLGASSGSSAQQSQGLGPNAASGAYSVRGMPPGGSPFR